MLAASPSHSPTNAFKRPVSNYGPGSAKLQSRPTSPSFTASMKKGSPSPYPAAQGTDQVPALVRPGYQNASTQYSPMSESTSISPASVLQKSERDTVNTHAAGPPSSGASHGPAIALPAVPANAQSLPRVDVQPGSPSTKRRQPVASAGKEMLPAVLDTKSLKRPRSLKKTAKVLPVRYEFCAVEDMVVLIADMISQLIETNDNLPLRDVVLTRFHSRTPPGISVLDYLQRLAKHATLTPPLLLSMVYYIDRLCSLYPAFSITTLTVHRFLITAATVAAKGLSDSFWNNSTYARVGGIKLAELGMLELEFLDRVDWRIVPNPEVLVDYYRGLIGRTDDYVLETEADGVTREPEAEEEAVADQPRGSEEGTGHKWDAWMADVAESTGIKPGAGKR